MTYNVKAAINNIVSLFATIQISYHSSVSIIGNHNLVDVILIVISFFGFRSIVGFFLNMKKWK